MVFTAKEIVVLVIGTGLAFASFKSEDPLIFFPCIGISWASFVYICVSHPGSIYVRFAIAIAISCAFVFLSFRTYRAARFQPGSAATAPSPSQTPVQGPSPRFTEKINHFNVMIGGGFFEIPNVNGTRWNLMTITPDDIGMGISRADEAQSDTDGKTRIVVTVNDNQLLMDADVLLRVGQPPIHVRHNEIFGTTLYGTLEEPGYDKQTSSNALEIVNNELLPVLQIVYMDNARVVINGVFLSGDSAVILNNGDIFGRFKPEDIKYDPIKRLFKYPSWKYPGEFEEKTLTPHASPTPDKGASPH